MSDVPLDHGDLQSAWRFGLVLTGCAEGVNTAFPAAVAEVLRHPDTADPVRTRCLFLSALRRRCLKFPARCELSEEAGRVHRMAEPGRSALILEGLGGISSEEIGRVLALDRKELAAALGKARTAWGGENTDSHVVEERLGAELAALPISEDGENSLTAAVEEFASHRKGHRTVMRNPAVVAVGFAFVLLAGVLVWHFLESATAFPEEAAKIATAGARVRADQFEPVEAKVGGLADWLVMKGVDRFYVPPEFASFTAVGFRTFRDEGETIVQIAVEENVMFFFNFPAAPFGLELPPGTWRVQEIDKRVAAVTQEGDLCFMVTFEGTKQDWESLWTQLRPRTY